MYAKMLIKDAKPFQKQPTSWHIGVSAEAFAAAQFARHGYDVSVQYGPNQPEYDLIVTRGDQLLKVSVKGSQDGGWGLTQSYMRAATELSGKKADYHGAIDLWLADHGPKTAFCLVQFQGVPLDEMPRLYLAAAREVAQWLHQARAGHGNSVMNENWTYTKGLCKGFTDRVPATWLFSKERIQQLFANEDTGLIVKART